jgi:ABC-type glycerol-3-phosphate transport system substrate-binding protein
MLNRRLPLSVRSLLIALCIVLLGPVMPTAWMSESGATIESESASTESSNELSSIVSAVERNRGTTYIEWLNTVSKSKSVAPSTLETIDIPAVDFSAVSDPDYFVKSGSELLWNDGDSWVEYEVNIPVDGLYNMGIVYYTVNESTVDIVRSVQIDGQSPFVEAENIKLKRAFQHSQYPPKKDEFKNDILPQSVELKQWQDVLFADYNASVQPLLWHFTQGVHKIRLINQQEPIRLRSLYVAAPQQVSYYKDVKNTIRLEKSTNEPFVQVVEGEKISAKSNTSIQLLSTDDTGVTPSTGGLIRYNTVGGEQFRMAGQWVEWEVEVPREGYYEIGFKFKQMYLNNSYSFRSITIDGQMPYKEMDKVGFPYNRSWGWDGLILSDEENAPIRFFLSRGKHTIRMTVTAAPIKPFYEGIIRNLDRISNLDQQIRKVTGNYEKSYSSGGNVDTNRDFQLEKFIPDLDDQMRTITEDLYNLADRLASITTGVSDVERSFRSTADDFAELRNRARDIANEMQTFEKNQQTLSQWAFRLLDQPLLIDKLWVAEAGADTPAFSPNMFEKMWGFVVGFLRSFILNYDFTRDDEEAIEVWVQRGRDYVRLIQLLTDEQFTAKTGIPVNVTIVTDPNLLILSNLAGTQPDIALGFSESMVVDFASRGTLADLNQFPDYKAVAQSFHPGALRAFHYDERDYAFPETQNFRVLMYRTDKLRELGLKPPDTWDDLYRMLPTLQQNGYDFFLPNDPIPFLYQNGAELYTPDGTRSGLNTEQAYEAIKQWTQMYTLFQIPKEVPSFFNHFRLGDIPIGVADFNTYLQTAVAAPEIAGKWKIAPLPGNKNASGVVERWAGGSLESAVMYKKSTNKQSAWEFMKWWTSEQTQVRFGNDIEAMFGPEFRWNTANLAAFAKLPWPREDLRIILDQWQWFKEAPQVPGGYFSGRQLSFAWQNVVTLSKNPREELERAVIQINFEMQRKQQEFGIQDANGNVLNPLNVVPLDKPWKGVTP